MLLDYANNGDPDNVIWKDSYGNEYDVDEVRWVDRNGTRETIVWQRRRALTITITNGTNSTNLQSRIQDEQDSIKPYKYIDFIIEANSVVGPISTGDLSSFTEVTLTNNGEIQGFRTTGVGGSALTLTTDLKLTNNGWIRGAGGRGGNGGSGRTYTQETFTDTVYYLYFNDDGDLNGGGTYGAFRYDSGSSLAAGWYWNGVDVYEQPAETEVWLQTPRKSDNTQYFRSLSQQSYGNGLEGHPIKKRTYFDATIHTGVGGAGGYGRGYKASPTTGSAGTTANGVTGGRGGNGGEWGSSGTSGSSASDGGTAGLTHGYAGGKGISGVSRLSSDSLIGSISGGTE